MELVRDRAWDNPQVQIQQEAKQCHNGRGQAVVSSTAMPVPANLSIVFLASGKGKTYTLVSTALQTTGTPQGMGMQLLAGIGTLAAPVQGNESMAALAAYPWGSDYRGRQQQGDWDCWHRELQWFKPKDKCDNLVQLSHNQLPPLRSQLQWAIGKLDSKDTNLRGREQTWDHPCLFNHCILHP